jgi:hypothetical protein
VTRTARWALAAYPPSFRDRYGPELEALVEDVGPSWRHTAGLYAGAARAWLRPAFTGPEPARRRLQATVATVWVAWCAGFLLVPAIDKALLDPPGAGVDATVRRLLDASAALLVVGWGLALLGVTLLVARTLLPALRARRWSVLRPLLPAVALGIVVTAGLLALALGARSGGSLQSPAAVALGTAWLAALLGFLASSGFGPAVTIGRLRPDAAVLRLPTMLAAALSLCLAAMTLSCAAAVLVAGGPTLFGMFAPVAAVLAVATVASSTAVVSSARGVLALRRHA